jgi:hypothetical protein
MMTVFVADFSFCVPRTETNYLSYGLIFHTVLDYSSKNRDTVTGYIDTKRD